MKKKEVILIPTGVGYLENVHVDITTVTGIELNLLVTRTHDSLRLILHPGQLPAGPVKIRFRQGLQQPMLIERGD